MVVACLYRPDKDRCAIFEQLLPIKDVARARNRMAQDTAAGIDNSCAYREAIRETPDCWAQKHTDIETYKGYS